MTNELLPTRIDFSDSKVLTTIKNTVAKSATAEEFTVFVEFCKSTGLNPFKKEIWFIKANNQVQMMTGINGFYTIANNHPQYDGIETELVEKNGQIVKAVAKVYRKDRKFPSVAEAYFEEYAKPYGNWKTMRRVMISKCAESMALRKAFPQELNGLYTQEEMPAEFAPAQSEPINVTPTAKQPETPQPAPVVEDAPPAPEATEVRPVGEYVYKYSIPYADTESRKQAKDFGCKWCAETKTWDLGEFVEDLARFLTNPPDLSLNDTDEIPY